MFEKTIKELNNMKNLTYSQDIPIDSEGYIDKECPNEECLFQFKVLAEDWRDKCNDEAIYCPKCGKSETSEKWYTTEQVEQAQRNAKAYITRRIGKALEMDSKVFNRKQNNSFIKLNMKVSGFGRVRELPLQCIELMEQKIQCEECGTRYCVIGSAFYCPCCGYNSSTNTFEEFIKTTKAKIDNLNVIRNAISNKDEAERVVRTLIETIPNDLIEAIQCLSEEIYDKLPNKREIRDNNVFQRIDESSELWKEATNSSYEDWLTSEEYEKMKKYYQQRHLLTHKNGIVDDRYIIKSNDVSYKVGERIVFNEANAKVFTNIIEKVGIEIKRLI